ncbi:MAG: serine/threonine-protein kinase, partial [Planctomycetota bacterium]
MKGEDLRSVFDRVHDPNDDGWNPTRALSLMLRVCEAMAYAHSKGVIHRDLKPANIMVGKYGETYVMDWGLARVLGKKDQKDLRIQPQPSQPSTAVGSHRRDAAGSTPDSPLITMDGDVVGTPAYMSPEQAAGRLEDIGPQSDVYAVGAMLYHLLAGHMPYLPPGMVLSQRAIWACVQQGPPSPLHQAAPTAPAELVAICEKAMARSIENRYRDMEELAVDLRAFLEHRVVAAYESGAIAELKKWVKRNQGLTATAAAAAVLLSAVLWWSFYRIQSERDTAEENEQTALTEKARATARKAEFDQLAGVVLLDEALAAEKELYPAWPEKIAAMENWFAQHAAKLASLKPTLAQTLSDLEARALPWSP